MSKITNTLIVLAAVALLGIGAWGGSYSTTDPDASYAALIGWAAYLATSLGLGIVVAVAVVKVQAWVRSSLEGDAPRVSIIRATERCDRLSDAILENRNDRMLTTRYSARSIGATAKSQAFLDALNLRISRKQKDTLRVIVLDLPGKVDHAMSLLEAHYANPSFGLKVVPPDARRLIDLMVSDGHFACLGIETRNPEENYWIRIDDPDIAKDFGAFYEEDHWSRPEAIEIKGRGKILSRSELTTAEAALRDLAKAHVPDYKP